MRTGRGLLGLGAVLALAASGPAAASGQSGWNTASSIGAYGLAGIALALPLARRDGKGALQAAEAMGAAQLVTYGLKEAFPETRPDRSDRKSFPSGHTSLAFAAATTLYGRTGAKAAIPAFLVAGFVGIARVKADKHHWYDCVAGAGIGVASGVLLTHRRDKAVAILPWGDSKGGGLSLAARF